MVVDRRQGTRRAKRVNHRKTRLCRFVFLILRRNGQWLGDKGRTVGGGGGVWSGWAGVLRVYYMSEKVEWMSGCVLRVYYMRCWRYVVLRVCYMVIWGGRGQGGCGSGGRGAPSRAGRRAVLSGLSGCNRATSRGVIPVFINKLNKYVGNEWMKEWMSEWVDEWISAWVSACVREWGCECMCQWVRQGIYWRGEWARQGMGKGDCY